MSRTTAVPGCRRTGNLRSAHYLWADLVGKRMGAPTTGVAIADYGIPTNEPHNGRIWFKTAHGPSRRIPVVRYLVHCCRFDWLITGISWAASDVCKLGTAEVTSS